MSKTSKEQPPRKRLLMGSVMPNIGNGRAVRAEKARLEAFLNALPLHYCGFAPDGALAYSPGFCQALGLASLKGIEDIQGALTPGDAAALEGLFTRLNETGEGFSLTVRSASLARTWRLSGRRGTAGDDNARFDVLWLEDLSAQTRIFAQLESAREAAEGERDRLQAALDQLPLPAWLRNARTEIIWCNRAYARALDTTPATVVAEQRELFLKPLGRPGLASKASGRLMAQTVLDSGKTEQIQAHVILSGSRRLVMACECPVPGGNMTLGFLQDITREEELETEQKRYSAANKELLEQLGSAIAIFDSEQRIEFYNSAFAQLWGLEDKYLNTRPRLGDLMERLRQTRHLPEQADFRKFKQSWLSMFTGLIGPHEDMMYLPDDRALRRLVVPHPMGGLMMTFEDVTRRLELESSYNTLIAVQKETLDNLAEGVAVFGGDGRLKLWNPSFARLWRLNPEDIESKPHITRLVDKIKPRFREADWREQRETLIAQSLDRNIREGRMECADGTLMAYSTVPLPDGGVLVTHADISASVRAETALREKNAALEAAERLKLDFLANVSYQLRTPMNAIMGFNEILDKEFFGPLNAKQKEYTAGIQEASERLTSLIDDILDLATIEAGYLTLHKDAVSIRDVLTSLLGLTTEWARKEKIEIRLECPAGIGVVEADEQRLKQVLLNLIRNAIAYTPPGGTIVLTARRKDGFVDLGVSDTGPGIAPEDQARVFEPFERVQNGAVTKNRGVGLGLTLVRDIIEMHGGNVTMESTGGKGTTVTLKLPERAG